MASCFGFIVKGVCPLLLPLVSLQPPYSGLIRLGRIGMFLSFHALFGEIITKSLPDKIYGTQVGAQVVGVKHDKETQASGGGGGTAAAARPPRLSRAMLAAVAAPCLAEL